MKVDFYFDTPSCHKTEVRFDCESHLTRIRQDKRLISRTCYRNHQSYTGIAVGFHGLVIVNAAC